MSESRRSLDYVLLETHVLQDTDPDLPALIADGFDVVGESWGAELRVPDDATARHLAAELRAYVDAVIRTGLEIREVLPADAPAIAALDAASWSDVPSTPATVHAPTTEAEAREWAARGHRGFGAFDRGALVGLCVGAGGDNGYIVVAPSHRGRGVGRAVTAAWMLGAIQAGERSLTAGGAAENSRSLDLVRTVGFRVTERWLSLQRR